MYMDFKMCVLGCIRYCFVNIFESQLYKLLFILNVNCPRSTQGTYPFCSILKTSKNLSSLKINYHTKIKRQRQKLLDLLNYEHLSGSKTLGRWNLPSVSSEQGYKSQFEIKLFLKLPWFYWFTGLNLEYKVSLHKSFSDRQIPTKQILDLIFAFSHLLTKPSKESTTCILNKSRVLMAC